MNYELRRLRSRELARKVADGTQLGQHVEHGSDLRHRLAQFFSELGDFWRVLRGVARPWPCIEADARLQPTLFSDLSVLKGR